MAESVVNKNITENVGGLIDFAGLKSFWNVAKTYIEQQLSKKYEKTEGGIPKDDLDSSVKASLDKADSATQGVEVFVGTLRTNSYGQYYFYKDPDNLYEKSLYQKAEDAYNAKKIPVLRIDTWDSFVFLTKTDNKYFGTGVSNNRDYRYVYKVELDNYEDKFTYLPFISEHQDISGKQENLVSGTNIKTINGESVLGSGDIDLQPTLVSDTNIKTIWGKDILGSGDLIEGNGCVASGMHSHAEGDKCQALGDGSHAEGDETTAWGKQSHAEGHKTEAWGSSSHTEGKNTMAYGMHSHAEGEETIAGGQYDEGGTYGDNSHAEGYGAQAIADASHAEGWNTQAGGLDDYGFVYGNYSHAEGESTNAIGEASHAEGGNTQAGGNHSHAEGFHTITNNAAEHACGKYNISSQGDTAADKTIFSVGIGSVNESKNGLEVRENGDIYIQKDGSYIKLQGEFDAKQDKLAAGSNIKTINGESILSSGNLSLITPTELRNQCYLKSEIDSMLGDINRILESIVNGGNYGYSAAGYSEADLLNIVDDVLVE